MLAWEEPGPGRPEALPGWRAAQRRWPRCRRTLPAGVRAVRRTPGRYAAWAPPGARAADPARSAGTNRVVLPRIRGRGEPLPGHPVVVRRSQPAVEQRPAVAVRRRSRPAVVVRRSRPVRWPPGWHRAPAAPVAGAGPHCRERCRGPASAGRPEALRRPPTPARQPPNARRYPRPPRAPTVRRWAGSAHRPQRVVPVPRAARDARRVWPGRRGRTAPRGPSRPRCSWRQRDSRVPKRPPPVPSRPTGPDLVGRPRRSTRVSAPAGRSSGPPAWVGWVPAGAPARWPGRPGVAPAPRPVRRPGVTAVPRPVRRPGVGPRLSRVGRRALAQAAAVLPRPGSTAPKRVPGSAPAAKRCPTPGPAVRPLPRRARPGSGARGAEVPSPDPAARRRTRCPASPAGRRMASVRQRPATPLPAVGRGGACLRTSCVRLLHQLRPRTPVRGTPTGVAGPRAPAALRTVSGPPEGRFREDLAATPCCRVVSIGFDSEPPLSDRRATTGHHRTGRRVMAKSRCQPVRAG